MDCNREAAVKAKENAEKKFSAMDIKGAMKSALKAQSLFPSLEGINQMISTLGVYHAAEKKINGEHDWYAILSVSASTDEETLKKRYRKLAIQLHPDKNKSVGAEDAFKLISEAWSVLSDKNKKMAFDQIRNANGVCNKAFQWHGSSSGHDPPNGFYSFSSPTTSSKRARKRKTSSVTSTAPQVHPVNLNTFWTSCNRCRMQYEYLRVYLNHNLLCPNCHQAFMAVEIGIPGNAAESSICWSTKQHQQNSNHNYTVENGYSSGFNTSTFPGTATMEFQHRPNFDSYNHQNFQWNSFTGSAGTAGTTDSSFHIANLNHKKYEKMKRKYEKAQAAARREDSSRAGFHVYQSSFEGSQNYTTDQQQPICKVGRPAKRKNNCDKNNICQETDASQNIPTFNRKPFDIEDQGAVSELPRSKMDARQSDPFKEFSQVNSRGMLLEKAKMAISKKLNQWKFSKTRRLKEKVQFRQTNGQKAGVVHKEASKQMFLAVSSMKEPTNDCADEKILRPVSIDVLDPDFYDFDKDRLEKTFHGDQVWAIYDSEDGMPRLYAMVQKVLSRNPFSIRMSFLTSKSNNELGPINWVASGYAKTCGDFRIGRYRITDTVNIFSHRVRWEKGPRGVIRIVPRKGDIWALYRNWSPDWNELTPDDVIFKYEMVEVLDDYQEECGVTVIPLVKVAGFKAVFHTHMDQMRVKRIAREEMFRFSHRVPSYLLTGEEAPNALKGCLELDPAATPLELLQVITEVKEDVSMELNEQR
ncbi:uncharacterized protein LOC122020214 [Zingiber officinale]|uniref:J domain-containing protein n=1 Tax=Zingiber officinale TaxID=94328 RepID=A0A8J5F621_ZINOF|nr:uncharacterized protein LOC122020214 [Zingiber officinale]KAG6479537.1 hypothetical protein ZIOFF_063003 [Zingiber officinale]